MTTSTQEIIENFIIGEIFTEFPTYLSRGAFKFFMEAGVDCTEFVSESPLGTEWGYEVCEAYELENIRAIRGLMQSMYSDLERLKTALFQHAAKDQTALLAACSMKLVYWEDPEGLTSQLCTAYEEDLKSADLNDVVQVFDLSGGDFEVMKSELRCVSSFEQKA